MAGMKVGETIGILCSVQPGPFSDERLITFETTDGPISGFVEESDLKQKNDEWFVRAVVLGIQGDAVQVRIRGSFFTTNGLASVPKRYAMAA